MRRLKADQVYSEQNRAREKARTKLADDNSCAKTRIRVKKCLQHNNLHRAQNCNKARFFTKNGWTKNAAYRNKCTNLATAARKAQLAEKGSTGDTTMLQM